MRYLLVKSLPRVISQLIGLPYPEVEVSPAAVETLDGSLFEVGTINAHFRFLSRNHYHGRFMTLDLLDRITSIGGALSSNLDKMTEQERNRYRHFLKTELRKVDQQQTQESNNINKKGPSNWICLYCSSYIDSVKEIVLKTYQQDDYFRFQ